MALNNDILNYGMPKTQAQIDQEKRDKKNADDKASWENFQANIPKYPNSIALNDPSSSWGLLNPGLQTQFDPIKAQEMAKMNDVGMTSNIAGLEGRLNNINLNTQGLEAIRNRALSYGPSAWATGMLGKQGVEEATARDNNSRLGRTALTSAENDLAMNGGLSGGARERLARMGNRDIASGAQSVARQGQLDRFGIGTSDEEQRLDLLKNLPGMEIAALQPELQKTSMWSGLADTEANRKLGLDLGNRDFEANRQKFNIQTDIDRQKYNTDSLFRNNSFNIQNSIAEKRARDEAELAKYQTTMAAYGANRTADAQEKPSWICTEVHKLMPLSIDEWKALFKFKRFAIKNRHEDASYYFNGCKNLLSSMKSSGFDFGKLRGFVLEVVGLVKMGAMQNACDLYLSKVQSLDIEFKGAI